MTQPVRAFAFCWQPENSTCRAVFVPFDLLPEQDQTRIVEMHARGPIFRQLFRQDGPSCSRSDGFALPTGEVDHSAELRRFLRQWKDWADSGELDLVRMAQTRVIVFKRGTHKFIEEDREPVQPQPWQAQSLFYWMNDKLGHLAPQDLYKAFCDMTQFQDQPLEVCYCIISTELESSVEKQRSLRFFYRLSPESSLENLRQGLLLRIAPQGGPADLTLAENEEANGYGYAMHLSTEQFTHLPDSTWEWDGNVVWFQ